MRTQNAWKTFLKCNKHQNHWLTRLQYNVGLCFQLHVKGQLFAEHPKFIKIALSGEEDPKDSFTEKSKYIIQL